MYIHIACTYTFWDTELVANAYIHTHTVNGFEIVDGETALKGVGDFRLGWNFRQRDTYRVGCSVGGCGWRGCERDEPNVTRPCGSDAPADCLHASRLCARAKDILGEVVPSCASGVHVASRTFVAQRER